MSSHWKQLICSIGTHKRQDLKFIQNYMCCKKTAVTSNTLILEKKLKFKRVLITGEAGYCGSILVPQLLDLGYHLTVYDILFYGSEHLPKEHLISGVVKGDIQDTPKLAEALKGQDACNKSGLHFPVT